MAEIQADKDALCAEFATSKRSIETTLDELKNTHSNALAELGGKGDAINRLKIEHEAQKVEFVALKAEVVTLTDQLTAAGKEIDAIKVECHADDLVFLAPRSWPADKELLNHAADAHDLGQRVELDEDPSDVGARLQPAESSIGVSSSTGIRIPSNFVYLLMIGLVGFGAVFAWQQHDAEGAKALIERSLVARLVLNRVNDKSAAGCRSRSQANWFDPCPAIPAHDAGLPQPEPIAPTPPAAAATLSEQNELATKQQAVAQ